MKKLVWVGMVLLVLGNIGCSSPEPPKRKYPWSEDTDMKYKKIAKGMTYAEVVAIWGTEGKKSPDDAYGVEQFFNETKLAGNDKAECFEWAPPDGAHIRVLFNDKKVVTYGLFHK